MSFETRSILDGRCTIHVGDCMDAMRRMPSGSVDCVVTSPPYWGLRDYGVVVKAKRSFAEGTSDLVETRNARNVWAIVPKAFRGAHFATFPPALAERCIKAGTPKTVCSCCGAPSGCGPICEVFGREPGTVFDPFGGAGTVGLVAEQLGLRSILVELNPEYAEIAVRRIEGAHKPKDEAA